MKEIVPFPKSPPSSQEPSKILLAAERLATERGLGRGFTFEDVAREAGVGLPEVMREFPDRMALDRAVVFRAVLSSQQSLGAPIEVADLQSLLSNFLHMAFDSIDEIEARYRVQVQAMALGGEVLSELVAATCAPIIQLIRSMIAEKRTDLTDAELDARATMFVGMCDQYAHMKWTYHPYLNFQSAPSRFFFEYRKLAEGHFVRAILA